jgi:hypothetical protein
MIVMFDLKEFATCRYKKLTSQHIYLHLNPTELSTKTSQQTFWTKHGFDPVNETLVITPLTATEDKDPVLRNQHALKTTAQAEVLAGLNELREHLEISPQDGKS